MNTTVSVCNSANEVHNNWYTTQPYISQLNDNKGWWLWTNRGNLFFSNKQEAEQALKAHRQ